MLNTPLHPKVIIIDTGTELMSNCLLLFLHAKADLSLILLKQLRIVFEKYICIHCDINKDWKERLLHRGFRTAMCIYA